MSIFNRFDSFTQAVAEKKHNLSSDTLKVILSNTAPVPTNTVKADIIELSAGGGYTAGGVQATVASATQTAGVYKLVLNDPQFVGTSGFGPFRYAVLYNSTATNGELIGWSDNGSAISVPALGSFTVDFDASLGALTIG